MPVIRQFAREVAERMGIDAPALSRLETGKMLNATLGALHKEAEALGRKLDVDLSFAWPAMPLGLSSRLFDILHVPSWLLAPPPIPFHHLSSLCNKR